MIAPRGMAGAGIVCGGGGVGMGDGWWGGEVGPCCGLGARLGERWAAWVGGGGEVCDAVRTSGVSWGEEGRLDGRSGGGIGSMCRVVDRDDAQGGGAEAAGLGWRAVFGG